MFADHRFDYLSQVRYYASFVITPVYWMADLPRSLAEALETSLRSRNALAEENSRLREELLLQNFQLQKLAHLTAEINRLNNLQNASSIVEEEVMRAQLISESPDPFSKRVLVNRGSNDGAFVGQPVLDAFGLVGQVVEVAPYTSWVLLITDPQHATPVQVNRNGGRAVASGIQGTLHQLELNNIPNTADIRVGDVLVSSGLGQTFPPGYPVGVVDTVTHDPGLPFAIVTATPTAQLDKSRNLLLLFEEEQVEEEQAARDQSGEGSAGEQSGEGPAREQNGEGREVSAGGGE